MQSQSFSMITRHSSSSSSSLSSHSSRAPRQPGRLGARPSVVLVRAAGGGAGGFGKSTKKSRVDTAGGMVVPKKLKNISTADLQDGASPSQRGASVDGAPPGFPEGWQDLKLTAADFPLGKTARPVELAGGGALMVRGWRW